jgi:Tol biopolymer transport system component
MGMTAGTRLGPYEILSLLGAGGMGEVYRARDPRLAREVAIKVLPGALNLDPERRARFEQEARAAGALNHHNIVAIFDIGSQDGALYVVEELLEGETLRQRLAQGPLPARKAIDYAVQAARGLAAAHAKGIVHRDLKPDNLFLTRDGRLKILDFGLAKLVAARKAAEDATSAPTEALGTQPGIVMGTAGYMSPEQVRGLAVDHRSDLFSLGAILFEALTGRRAFQGESAMDAMSAILKEEPPELSTVTRNLPAGLERIVHHCLEKNPEERFHSAQDLAFDLESLSTASGSAQAQRSAAAPSRRKSVVTALVAAAALIAGVVAGRMFLAPRGPDLAAYTFTALATEQGGKLAPAWSPDGTTIAYSAEVGGVYQIFTRSLTEPVPAQITHSATNCMAPFWAPDNTHLFYTTMGAPRVLWEIGAAGGAPRERIRDLLAASISPDGKTLAFARMEQDRQVSLWAQPLEGSAPRRVGPGFTGIDAYLSFSPNGAWLGIWSRVGEGNADFQLVSWPQGSARRTMGGMAVTYGPRTFTFSWFPDSRHVAFSGALTNLGSNHLIIADARTGAVQPVTTGVGNELEPSVSADGRRIAFTVANADTDIMEVPVDGGPMRAVLATSRSEHCAAWSPTGDQFVYSKDHNGTNEVWIHNVREGWERPLITRASFRDGPTDRVSEARYSPDGQRVAFLRVSDGQYSAWLASVAGGPPVPVTQGYASVPAWSPDGSWILYNTLRNGKYGLAKIAAGGGGQPVQIAPESTELYPRAQWSPRGDWIAWVTQKGLTLVSPDGARTELLNPDPGWQSYGFSKDGSQVYGIRMNEAHRLITEAVDIATRRVKIVSDLGPAMGVHAFSLAPDGKSFLTSLQRYHGDIWILEGFPQPTELFGKWWGR